MKNFLFILAAIFALSTTQASAEEDFYAGVFGGANWLNVSGKSHHNSSCSEEGSRIRDRLKFDTGYIIGGSIGYRWCGGLRVEGEIAYRNNQRKKNHKNHSSDCDEVVVIDDCSSSYYSSSSHHSSGSRRNAQTVSYMANVLYDLPFECTPWKAFVGAGIGYAQQKGTSRHDRFENNSSDYSCSYSYSDCSSSYSDSSCYSSSSDSCRKKHSNNGGFAAQAILGLGYNYCDCFELTLEYRYLYVSGSRNANSNNNAIIVGAQTGF